MFGESGYDRRDYILALAGLTAGVHALRITAEHGLSSREDMSVAVDGVRAILAQLPEGGLDAQQALRIDALLRSLPDVAASARREEAFAVSPAPAENMAQTSPTIAAGETTLVGGMRVYRRSELDDHGNYIGPQGTEHG